MSRWLPTARALAIFLGGFSLLNLVGELRATGFDANLWWIDFRPLPAWLSRLALGVSGFTLLAFAVRPEMVRWRRAITLGVIAALLAVTLGNAGRFWWLLARGEVTTACPVPFSLLVSAALGIVLYVGWSLLPVRRLKSDGRARVTILRWFVFFATLGACLVGFPVAQMFCFGLTDYRRPADAIVVLGAKAYADGTPSQALADRVRTGCQLYHAGLAPRIVFSGGPGDGDVHETESMRRFARSLGVPDDAILLDPRGWNTRLTAEHSSKLLDEHGARRVLVVSHFYHLPRIKLAFQREGRDVFTVPAEQTEPLVGLPRYMLREVAALWVYYLAPLASTG
ncbi:MAG: YdcF family protein [Planctomycetales bacterium]|nr:YdcF family protein [Planctomycetales bacterium]